MYGVPLRNVFDGIIVRGEAKDHVHARKETPAVHGLTLLEFIVYNS
jgi:hypothetical protein